jgi:hypothetical protein
MKQETAVIFRSVISQTLWRRRVLRGTLIGGIGVILLFIAAVFFPSVEMKRFGFILFLLSVGLITWGFLPYKKLKRLEVRPNTLSISQDGVVSLSLNGHSVLQVPLQAIDKAFYVEEGDLYGIGVVFRNDCTDQILKEHPHLKDLFGIRGCDILFPYFSERSCADFKEYLL